MNLKISDAIVTEKDGETFYKLSEVFVKGNALKSVQTIDGVMENLREKLEGSKQVKGKDRKPDKR